MDKEIFQRLLYLDSEVNVVGDGEEVRIDLPAEPFTVGAKEKIKLVLNSFQLRRQFYSINQYNSYFTILNTGAGTYQEFQIANGSYDNFTDLAAAIQATLVAAYGAGNTVAYDDITRKFSIQLGGTAPANARFIFFQAPQGTPPANVNNLFQDTHEIFGGKRNRLTTGTLTPGLRELGGNAFESFYPAALGSIEAIYIRVNLQNNNYQTYGYSANLPYQQGGVTPSQIFARIPLTHNVQTPNANNFIEFSDDGAELFQITLGQKVFDNITIRLTDDKGRPLPLVEPDQATEGNFTFKMVMKYAVVEDVPSPMKLLEKLLMKSQPDISQNPDLRLDYYTAPRR